MPFYPSPMRDDGYDVADYEDVHPPYGTREDFKRFVREAHERGLRVITELIVNHTSDQHPWFQAARRAPAGSRQARLLRLERRPEQVRRHAHHLHRHRDVQLGVGPGGAAVLLAPLLQPPARPQLRQPARAARGAAHHALLARHGRRRLPARRHPLPGRARGHQQREQPRDARGHQADPRRPRRSTTAASCCSPRPTVARGRAPVLRRRRRVPHGVPLPADAAALHVDRDGGPPSAGGDHGADPAHPGQLPVGDLPAQPRRAHARDGDRPRARLHVPHLRRRPAHAHQRRHPPAPGAADGEQPRRRSSSSPSC